MPLQEQPLDQDAEAADGERGQDQRPPVADAEIGEQEPGAEGAQHVLGPVGEVDDVEQAEDHGEPEREDGVERAVDEADQELAEQHLRRDPEKFLHGRRSPRALGVLYCCTSGQPPSASGRNASAAGIVARSL